MIDLLKGKRIEYARKLEEIERGKARERMTEGINQYSPRQNSAQGEQAKNGAVRENFPEQGCGRARDIVAEKSGFGNKET